MTGCPDPSVLESFAQGTLSPASRTAVEAHLDACPDCAQTIAALARLFGSVTRPSQGEGSWMPTIGGSQPAATREGEAPVTVGRYQLGRRLGAGGMGVVFEAHDPELHRQVAIKLLHPGEDDEAELTAARLLREARAMAQLAHPNVVAVHDVGRAGEQVFVAMELVEGATLGQWLKARPRTRREILDVFVQAGRGLQAAHEVGLVHRDFKPDNVLIGGDGRARVTDFGLARPVVAWAETEPVPQVPEGVDPLGVSTAVTTAFGTIVGTPAYMAPEQWRGEAVDARSDQFSFCVALFEALFGPRPFEGDQWMALCHNVLEGRMRPVPRSAPKWLRAALLRGLAVAPAQRHASMGALLQALSRDRSTWLRVGAIAGAMAAGAAATVGVLAWIADETTPTAAEDSTQAESEAGSAPDAGGDAEEAKAPAVDPALQACRQQAQTVGGLWNTERRSALAERIDRMEEGKTLAALTLPRLDAWAQTYGRLAAARCEALGDPLADARGRCLDDRRRRFDALLLRARELETFQVQGAIAGAALDLPRLDRCDDPVWLRAWPAPPSVEQEARARLLATDVAAAEADAALRQLTAAPGRAEAAATEAEALGYAPLRAEAQLLVGSIAATRGQPDIAVSWLEKAALSAETGGHAEVQASSALALMRQQGVARLRPAEVERWQRQATSLAERTNDARLKAEVTLAQGQVLHARLEMEGARETLTEAIEQQEQAHGAGHPRVAQARLALARVLIDLGEARAAIDQARVAAETLHQALGPLDLELGVAQRVRAQALLAAGEHDQALQAVAVAERIPGLSSSLRHDYDHCDALLVHGDILAARDEVDEALERYRKAEIYCYTGPRKADPLLRRGSLLVRTGAHDDGHRALLEALTELQTHYESEDPRLVQALRAVARAEAAADRIAEARAHLHRALELADRHFGFGPFKARLLLDLAAVERQSGRLERALELYDDAHVPWVGAWGMDHPLVVEELLARADLAYALGQLEYAGRLYRSTHDRFVEIYGESSPAVQRARERRTPE